MLFSSLEFLYGFLPVVLLLYFLAPKQARNGILLLASLFFYAWGEPKYLLLMLFTIFADYLFGIWIGRTEGRKGKRLLLVLAVCLNLALLGFFKYTDLVIATLRTLPALSSLRPLSLALPIGISFYTFQALSYVVDVSRGEVEAQKSIVRFGLYVTLFPQLIAGPIVRYRDIDDQLSERTHSLPLAASGARTFLCGLAKKVFLANAFGEIWKSVYEMPSEMRTVLLVYLGIASFMMQIYFDFSGYSDMAIGLGRIFGFRFLENFDYPYTATSVTDFWRRWHISLSTWFREYVYIPLGGNRKGRGRTYRNLLIVWLLTGLWHGAAWNFLLWGLYYAFLLILEKAWLLKVLQRIPKIFSHLYTLLAILFGWLIFAFDGSVEALSPASGLLYLSQMFGQNVAAFAYSEDLYRLLRYGLLFVIAAAASTSLPHRLYDRFYKKQRGGTALLLSNLLSFVVLLLATAYLVSSSYNPFLYFRF